jgi:hypothetical protein
MEQGFTGQVAQAGCTGGVRRIYEANYVAVKSMFFFFRNSVGLLTKSFLFIVE